MNTEARQILEAVKSGSMSVDEALLTLKSDPFDDIGFAKVDIHRKLRQGVAEVIYGEGKTAQQITGIIDSMTASGQENILITRLDKDTAARIHRDIDYDDISRTATVGEYPEPDGIGKIVICTGGTCDIPVAEEAAVTAAFLGNDVRRIYDVGVAGLHRLLSCKRDIMSASVIIAIAGMEGALASVIGGLADCPVIAVPTSVGYGASFAGVTPLLGMLSSCAAGVSVVNIDNGFGAGYLASMINHVARRQ
ncbi:MAG: nickel pincer cofactor biosynthesis protein LarB [Oscillospiraceae bacterium]|nr:nickel pincer cofactor biosynthesis protein LarB [Oscillospiraceae bacterium]